MAYRIINRVPIIKTANQAAIPIAIRFMLENTHDLALPKTPRDTGDLSKNVSKVILGRRGIITWAMNYAIYQEKKQYSNYTTPGTGPHYAENAVQNTIDNADNFFRKARVY